MYDTTARKPLTFQLELQGGLDNLVIATDLQLTDTSGNFLRIDGGGADREVIMPTRPVPFLIVNTGATNALNLAASVGVPIQGVTTALAPNRQAWVVLDEETNQWRHTGIVTANP